jgi:hypothetical protein
LRRHKLVVRVGAGLALAGAVAVVSASAAAPSSARSASACTPSWQRVPAANAGTFPTLLDENGFRRVAAQSTTNAWAVGSQTNLIEHWDGVQWSVSQPNTDQFKGTGKVLTAVAAASSSAAWAVGYHTTGSFAAPVYSQLIERWNGTSWSFDHAPRSPDQHTWLNDVNAVATNDVWAVGVHTVKPAQGRLRVARTLIEHWNGTAWTVIPSPNIGPATDRRTRSGWEWASDNRLQSIAVVSADDIWAVGGYAFPLHRHNKPYYSENYRVMPLAEHWNGTHWKIGPRVPSRGTTLRIVPNPFGRDLPGINPGQSGFTFVTADPSGDVLALDDANATVWRLSGSAWSRLRQTGALHFLPVTVTVIAPDDAWIFGYSYDLSKNLAAHWDGQTWTQTRLYTGNSGSLNAAAASGSDDVWVVGISDESPLQLHYTC